MNAFDVLVRCFMEHQKKEQLARKKDGISMDDYAEFRKQYQEQLDQAVANAEMPPELLEQFEFVDCLKMNDQKEIYIVKRKSDGVKALLRITKDYPEEDAVQEAEILKALNHPGIPKVFASYDQEDRSFIVREYFEGQTLAEYVQKNGAMSPKEIREFVARICDILSYIHGQEPSVIHRDIKPQNIILASNGDVKLIDFGIAREYNSTQTRDTTVMLTKPYAPPEQFGYMQSDRRSDIYSLGKVLLYMATGNAELTESIKDHRDVDKLKPFRQVEDIALGQDGHLKETIAHCLRFDPTRRFQSIHDFTVFLAKRNPVAITAATWAFGSDLDEDLLNEMDEEYIVRFCVKALETLAGSNWVNKESRFHSITNYLFKRLKVAQTFHYERACTYALDSVPYKGDSKYARYSKCDYTCDGGMYANCDYHEPTYAYFLTGNTHSSSIEDIIEYVYEIIDKRNSEKQSENDSERPGGPLTDSYTAKIIRGLLIQIPPRWAFPGQTLFYGVHPDYAALNAYIYAKSADVIAYECGEVLGSIHLAGGHLRLPEELQKKGGQICLRGMYDHFELFPSEYLSSIFK